MEKKNEPNRNFFLKNKNQNNNQKKPTNTNTPPPNYTLLCSVTKTCKYNKYSPDHFFAGTENSTFRQFVWVHVLFTDTSKQKKTKQKTVPWIWYKTKGELFDLSGICKNQLLGGVMPTENTTPPKKNVLLRRAHRYSGLIIKSHGWWIQSPLN